MSATRIVHSSDATSNRANKARNGEIQWLAHLPASRVRVVTRGMLWAAPAALLWITAISIYASLDFSPTGVSNRITEYGMAAITLIIFAGSLWTSIRSLRWLLMGCWPGPVGVFANERELILALGPGGTKQFDVVRLDILYAFECTDELTDEGFEAYLPEEEQKRLFLPRIIHPQVTDRINQLILDSFLADEASAAAVLRPAIEHWRMQQEPLDGDPTPEHEVTH